MPTRSRDLRRSRDPAVPPLLVDAQLGGAQKRGGSGGVRGPPLRAASGGLQGRRDLLVGRERHHRLMPHASIDLLVAGEHPGQGHVGALALVDRRRLVNGRADKGMPEGDGTPLAADQPCALGRIEGVRRHVELRGSPQQR